MSLDERSESIGIVGVSVDAEIAFQLFYLAMEYPRFDRVLFDRFVACLLYTSYRENLR